MPDRANDVFESQIRPVLFGGLEAGQSYPEFALLVGRPGSGTSRLVGRLLAPQEKKWTALRGSDLSAFRNASEGPDDLREWMTRALAYARDNKISMLLEDRFESADAAAKMLATFAQVGFQTSLAIVLTSRAESLLASVALAVRRGATIDPATTLRESDVGVGTVIALTTAAPDGTKIRLFDAGGVEVVPAGSFDREPLEAIATPPAGRAAAEWISELRRITEVIATDPREQAQLSAVVSELHRIAIRDVVPGLALPEQSSVRTQIEARLRRSLAELQIEDSVATPERAQTGVSRPGPDGP